MNSQKIVGLSSREAKKRIEHYGKNVITEGSKRTIIQIFFEQFQNFLILLLLVATVFAFILGEVVDGSLILTIVILNALFGVYQERKAENAIEALKDMTKSKVRVVRDNIEIEIDSEDLVPGDLIYIEEGIKVPADGLVLESVNAEINEAGLTGESLPVAKHAHDEVYSGTIVSKGRAKVQIKSTGMKTKFGQIAASLSSIDKSKTLLEQKLEQFTKLIGIFGVVGCFVVIFLSYAQGDGLFLSILFGISLAVAVVPEGLPAVMTVTLAIGVRSMADKKAILRKLAAIEALGSITIIATDKTGTLTQNSMQVKELWINDELKHASKLGNIGPYTRLLIDNGILCSTASLTPMHDGGNTWQTLGDPTEGALLMLGEVSGIHYEKVRNKSEVLFEQPFNSKTKRMSVISDYNDEAYTFTKGATESVLSISTHIQVGDEIREFDEDKRQQVIEVMNNWAEKGLRVLAFSYQKHKDVVQQRLRSLRREKLSSQDQDFLDKTFNDGQIFQGMVAMYDPPREEVKDSLQRAKEAGIRTVMITGDNEKTAESIATAINLIEEGDTILTGKQLEEYTDKQLLDILRSVRIFARTTPFHKKRIVELYQKLGEIVAVTGDGVNDSIALKQANVGVAMGRVGTDVAKETADMVITDDNFATIVVAIEEGRNIIRNIKNTIKYLLAANLVEGVVIISSLIFGLGKILAPIQILYINLLSDSVPSLSLAFSPKDKKAMQRKPEKKIQLLDNLDKKYILFVGAVSSILVFFSYYISSVVNPGSESGAVFLTLTMVQPIIYVNLWLTHKNILAHGKLLINGLFIGSFIYPFIALWIVTSNATTAEFFRVSSIQVWQFFMYVGIASLALIPVTLFNTFYYSKRRK